MKKTNLVFNKSVYLGPCVLDLSKWKMCNFHYNYILANCNGETRLLFTNRYSLCYEIENEDFCNGISCDVDRRFEKISSRTIIKVE